MLVEPGVECAGAWPQADPPDRRALRRPFAHPIPGPPCWQAFIYLASIQLLFSAPPATVLAGGCGLLAGLLYRLNFLRVQRLRLPAAVVELFSSTFGRVLAGPGQPQQVFVTPAAAQAQQAAAAAGGGFAPYAGRQGQAVQRSGGGAAVEPSPEAVQQLVAMGFDEQQARGALRQTGNSVEAALQYLL